MELELQIQSLIFSFVYGMFFSLLLNLNYHIVVNVNNWYKIILSFLFVVATVLVYFIIIRLINDGIIHFYFLLVFLCGVFIAERKTYVIRRKCQKKVNNSEKRDNILTKD